ncbi:hypothetical protein C8J38_106201 [Rhizobium sp. PP-WC-2G-219]|nr:hypothetical protein C8J38_106201 [Rhizobium sp. PP-WC-2G-219]
MLYRLVLKRVAYSKQAESYLKRVQHRRRKAIVEKIEAYARGESVDAKPLKGGTMVRIRIGGDRAIVDSLTALVIVVKVGPRGDVYKE